ncbi:MAG: HIT domain-containing protein [bacterium]|nr:HIT domain-containing protein [bacterium]
MKQLWAPWRMAYIRSAHEENAPCLFCKIQNEKSDKVNLILARGKFSFVMMNKFPYTNGHLMVVPFQHTADLSKITNDELLEINHFIRLSCQILTEFCHPQGFNIGMNLGMVAGAGITEHLHQHIVPRWLGDTNFMPILTDTRIISESIETTYEELVKLLQKRTSSMFF